MMLDPHIFGGAPAAFRIIAISSALSFCCCGLAAFFRNAAGLIVVGFVLAIQKKSRRGFPRRLLSLG